MHPRHTCTPLPANGLQAVWDPEHKRPHQALVYAGEEVSQPSEELLLDYTFASYWSNLVRAAGCAAFRCRGARGCISCSWVHCQNASASCWLEYPGDQQQLHGNDARYGHPHLVSLQVIKARQAHEEYAELAGEVRCARCAHLPAHLPALPARLPLHYALQD